jgi:hypothetical protein
MKGFSVDALEAREMCLELEDGDGELLLPFDEDAVSPSWRSAKLSIRGFVMLDGRGGGIDLRVVDGMGWARGVWYEARFCPVGL